jgi:tRNA/rRNA methyltransferase
MPNTQNLFIHTVLVRPQYPKNIGQSIRATANCGFGSVHVINPECELSDEMRKWAAGAQESVSQIRIYNSWEDFNNEHAGSFRLGLTRRTGKHRKLVPLEEGALTCFSSPSFNNKLFLVFGPEDDGLNTDDLNHVNMCCNLTLYGDFKSLNLAHAVLLTQHTAHRVYFENKFGSANDPLQADDTMAFPDEALMDWLKSSGVQKSKTKLNTFEVIKKTILRAFPSQKELSTFEKAFRASVNKD